MEFQRILGKVEYLLRNYDFKDMKIKRAVAIGAVAGAANACIYEEPNLFLAFSIGVVCTQTLMVLRPFFATNSRWEEEQMAIEVRLKEYGGRS